MYVVAKPYQRKHLCLAACRRGNAQLTKAEKHICRQQPDPTPAFANIIQEISTRSYKCSGFETYPSVVDLVLMDQGTWEDSSFRRVSFAVANQRWSTNALESRNMFGNLAQS